MVKWQTRQLEGLVGNIPRGGSSPLPSTNFAMDNPSEPSRDADSGELAPDPEPLFKLANWHMPFGKYKGRALIDLPEPYVVWFANNGFPKGELGQLLQLLYEIKLNGLEHLVRPLKGVSQGKRTPTR